MAAVSPAPTPATKITKSSSPPRVWLAPLLIFLLALGVRFVGLTWGLPNAERWYSYHPDESVNQVVGAVSRILAGDFNPGFFNYPSLTIYLTSLIYFLMAGLGLTTNAGTTEYAWPLVRDVLLAGRLLAVFCGAGTALVTYFLAREIGLRRGAVLAGFLMALAPGHVQHSHFSTVDVPATFFAALCLLLTLRARTIKTLLWAAFVAGLAAGAKYNVGLVVVAPMVRLWLEPMDAMAKPTVKPHAFRRIGLIIGASVVALLAFLLTTPYALLDFPTFWGDENGNGFYYEAAVHPRIGHGEIFQQTGNGWWYHFSFNLPFVLTWPLIIGALVGLFFAVKQRVWWPLLAFVGLFFFSLGFSEVRFMRYLFPLVPVLCVLAAWGAAKLPRPTLWSAILGLSVLAALPGILWPFVREDARDQAARFIRGRAETVGLIHNPWFYTPPFQPRGLNQPIEGTVVTGFDVQKLEAQRPDVFAVSELETREKLRLNPNGEAAQFVRALEQNYQQQFTYPSGADLSLPGREFVPHDYLYTRAQVTVYSLPRR